MLQLLLKNVCYSFSSERCCCYFSGDEFALKGLYFCRFVFGVCFVVNSKDSYTNLNTRGICIFYKYFPTSVLPKYCPSSSCSPHFKTPLTHCHWGLAVLELKAGQRFWEGGMAVLVKTHRVNPCISLYTARVRDHWIPCYVEKIYIYKIQENSENGLCQSNLQTLQVNSILTAI